MDMLIKYQGLIFAGIIYVIGFLFDRYKQSYERTIRGERTGTWEYFAHASAELGSLFAFVLFCIQNPDEPYWIWVGIIAWCVGTFVMALFQGKGVFYIGNGKGNTVEALFMFVSRLLNMIFSRKRRRFNMKNVSGFVRVVLILLSIYKLLG